MRACTSRLQIKRPYQLTCNWLQGQGTCNWLQGLCSSHHSLPLPAAPSPQSGAQQPACRTKNLLASKPCLLPHDECSLLRACFPNQSHLLQLFKHLQVVFGHQLQIWPSPGNNSKQLSKNCCARVLHHCPWLGAAVTAALSTTMFQLLQKP